MRPKSDDGDPVRERNSASLPPEWVVELRSGLLDFFDVHARDLPWRRTRDAYSIWVSEVMLQQTRVETAAPYYERWIRRFPDVEALARADLEDVLKAWEGLGYYHRARSLHRAAGMVRDRGGRLPTTAAELRLLPGIGAYTAGAIASIAFDRREAAVDGNVRRVLARLLDLADPTPGELRAQAEALVPSDRPGDFNQALMELGATVCTPRNPDCGACPIAELCRARTAGTQEERPARRPRKAVPTAEIGVAVSVRGSGDRWWAALVRRPMDGMLGGLWEFPADRIERGDNPASAARRAASASGVQVDFTRRRLPAVRHDYSHLRAFYHPFLFEIGGRAVPPPPPVEEGLRWMDLVEMDSSPLPGAQRAIVRSLVAVMP